MRINVTHPQATWYIQLQIQGENNKRMKGWGMLPNLQHFRGRRACWSSRMGTRTSDKQVNYSHEPTQTAQQVD
jgi:hypothetical protein